MLRPALYYPYIHIRSEHWLKATLLCVPVVKRIVPQSYSPEDSPEIRRYVELSGPHGPLLQGVPSSTYASTAAQQRLLEQILTHSSSIRKRFSRKRTINTNHYWVHDAKVAQPLLEYLKEEDLAWHSADPHGYVNRNGYALHPALGRAIMTTIGLSIAADENYDIVTADSVYHEALLANRQNQVFTALLEEDVFASAQERTAAQVERELGQLCITLTGVNYKALRPESIPELQSSSRFQAFQRTLRVSASSIDKEGDDEHFDAQIREEADKIVSSWHDVKPDLNKELRELLYASAECALTLLEISQSGIKPAAVTKGGIAVVRLAEKAGRILKRSSEPIQYLTEIVQAQDNHLRITYPLGLEI